MQNTQNIKSQQEIRSIVAEAISVPEQNINFVKIFLKLIIFQKLKLSFLIFLIALLISSSF